MNKLFLTLSIIALQSFAFAAEAPPDMKQFNVHCPAEELCPLIDIAYDKCRATKKEPVCSVYVSLFERLMPMYDCQHKIDHTPTKNYITPAIYLCDEVKAFYYMELLSKIELLEAKRIFASQDFREILDGYFWEAYFDLSHQLEKELRSKGLMKGK